MFTERNSVCLPEIYISQLRKNYEKFTLGYIFAGLIDDKSALLKRMLIRQASSAQSQRMTTQSNDSTFNDVNFRSDTIIITSNLAASRHHQIWRWNVLLLIDKSPCSNTASRRAEDTPLASHWNKCIASSPLSDIFVLGNEIVYVFLDALATRVCMPSHWKLLSQPDLSMSWAPWPPSTVLDF